MPGDREIRAWTVRLDAPAERVAVWRSMLSPAELRRADGFIHEVHRCEYITAHAALRRVIGDCLGISAGEVRIDSGLGSEGGISSIKPRLAAELGRDLRFNLSHTAGLALVAVSWGLELGIDAERHRRFEDEEELESLARAVMSATELARWSALGSEEKLEAFFRLWTRKESYLKAIGLGLYRSLQEVSVPVTVATLTDWHRVVDSEDAEAGTGWQVVDIEAPHGCSAAVCVNGGAAAIVVEEMKHERIV